MKTCPNKNSLAESWEGLALCKLSWAFPSLYSAQYRKLQPKRTSRAFGFFFFLSWHYLTQQIISFLSSSCVKHRYLPFLCCSWHWKGIILVDPLCDRMELDNKQINGILSKGDFTVSMCLFCQYSLSNPSPVHLIHLYDTKKWVSLWP